MTVSTPTAISPTMSADDAQGLFAGVVAEAVIELFRDYGVRLTPTPREAVSAQRLPDLISLAKFVGRDLSGCLVLGATHDLIEKSGSETSARRDWMAELANQLLGRVKTHAQRKGIGFGVVPPAVVSGEHLVPATTRPDFQPTFLSGAGGIVCLWIELETAPQIEVDVDLAGSVVVSESDVLLF